LRSVRMTTHGWWPTPAMIDVRWPTSVNDEPDRWRARQLQIGSSRLANLEPAPDTISIWSWND
jgi:hypothetical protein